MGLRMPTATERRIAEAMCMADGQSPFELVMRTDVLITDSNLSEQRWETYVAEARRFIAAMQAMSFNE